MGATPKTIDNVVRQGIAGVNASLEMCQSVRENEDPETGDGKAKA